MIWHPGLCCLYGNERKDVRAIAETREAVSGSALENRLVCYPMAYHPAQEHAPVFSRRPIPVRAGDGSGG